MRLVAALSSSGYAVNEKAHGGDREVMRVVAAALNSSAWRPEIMNVVAALSSTDYDAAAGSATAAIYPYLLASYAFREAHADRLPARVAGARMVWIDSGAFSVWTKGESVNLKHYIRHLELLRARLAMPIIPINLDVIPGQRGRAPTREETQASLAANIANAQTIRRAGLPVMEVWHRGEPYDHLTGILERRQAGELVGIGGLVGLHPGAVRQVCDPVWHTIREWCGGWENTPPVHALGVGNRDILMRYPWWSADSTSWIMPGTFGRVIKRGGNTGKDPRTRVREMRFHECARVLRMWLRWNDELTRMWDARGVRHVTPPCESTPP